MHLVLMRDEISIREEHFSAPSAPLSLLERIHLRVMS
jgi:hypothetical protein